MIVDRDEDELRYSLPCKWGLVDEDVLPAWVAESDYAWAPPIAAALSEAVARGLTGYPDFDNGGPIGSAYAGFAERQFGHRVEPGWVIPTADVTAGVRLALDVLSEPGAVVMPIPGYTPQLAIAEITGRERVDLVVDPDAERAEIDLDALDRLFADGARTLLLTQPHNPWGRVFTRTELEGIRDVVRRHGARVVSDEIHAPLVLSPPSATMPPTPSPSGRTKPQDASSPAGEGHGLHVPYLSLDGTADHAVAVVAGSKAFNTQGLKCAQIIAPDPATNARLRDVPMARNDSWSPLGVVAAVAAYTDCDDWLDALRARLSSQRDLLLELLAEHLPEARMRPLEATYLAWIDLRAYGHDDPAAVVLEDGRVRLSPGHDYHPGLPGHVRLNIATSPDRLTEIVRRMGKALG